MLGIDPTSYLISTYTLIVDILLILEKQRLIEINDDHEEIIVFYKGR